MLFGWNTEAWMEDGLCIEVDPDLFFPEHSRSVQAKQAKATCIRCDVRERCLEYALQSHEEEGIWGALDWNERQALKKRVA